MSNPLPTAHQIDRWVPKRLKDYIACDGIRNALLDHLRADGDGANIVITGETGTGKTALVEAYMRTLTCPHAADPLLGPCGQCDDCKTFDFEHCDAGILARCRTKATDNHAGPTHFFHINGFHLHQSEIDDLAKEIGECGTDRSIVYLDEIQGLAVGRLDMLLLKPIRESNAVWIATGITTDALSPMFVRRFAIRCKTTRPNEEELALFLLTRCKDWKIEIDAPDTLVLLAQRSRHITAECISVLARAATGECRLLSRQLVEDHPFITGVTR